MTKKRRPLPVFFPLLALLAGCAGPPVQKTATAKPAVVMTGIDVLEETGFRGLRGMRVGLITNHTGKNAKGRSTVQILAGTEEVTLAALFAPEHGFAGTLDDVIASSSSLRIGRKEIPHFSLYAGGIAGMRPKPEQLAGLEALVFDIQDIGARFYTYLATMGMALEAAAKARIPFFVLDRPNPINGVTVEGPMLTDRSLPKISPTSYFPIPVRHGMTAGEMARLHNASVKHPGLRVVKMRDWKRGMWYDQTGLPWTAPSPNMPDLAAAALYPGIGLFEASNVSVGRGTPAPFGWIGAPWMDAEKIVEILSPALLDGVQFSVQEYAPTKSVYAGKKCPGVRITVTDRESLRPLAVFRHLNQALRDTHREEFEWRWDEARRMMGSAEFERNYEREGDPVKFMQLFNQDAERFEKDRRPFLLYQ